MELAKLTVAIVQLVATMVLAIAAFVIAYLQSRTGHQNLVLDLFERRMAIYDELQRILCSVLANNRSVDQDLLARFDQARFLTAEYLFGDDIVQHLRSIS